MTHRQPPLRGEATPVLKLPYKGIGDPDWPEVTRAEFLFALDWIFRVVYGVETSRSSPLFTDTKRFLGSSATDLVKWQS